MEFLFKTRGGSNPQGKARVFLLGQPEDFELYFNEVSDQILKYQNCAVWYTQAGIITGGQGTEWYLSQMQLFVVIVTERFLRQNGDVAQLICHYSEKLHIPILPILFDMGIDKLYAVYFKERHYLSPVSNEQYKTDISYEKKLEHYLADVLVGDEEIEQIRKEFDAYIFMSYRKKDREHALNLMKRIHQSVYFQKVAIWYDEFLTPGVSFANKIGEKLQTSDLFVMVVTPNLLEKDNYVRTVEYVEAVKERKKIFPVEMVKTESAELQQAFENIPECVDSESGAIFDKQLYESLMDSLGPVDMSSPEKNYYIGLAYLDGVDVEVNAERALELISKAAEGGYVDAYEKLVVMYREGKGVKRNLAVSVDWQKRLIQRLQRTYRTAPSKLIKNKLFNALFEIVETYEREDLIEQAEQYIYDMAELLDDYNEYEDLIIYSRLLLKLGNVELQKGKVKDAREYYYKSIEIRQQIVEMVEDESERLESIRDISAVYMNLGDLERTVHNFPHAQEYYARAGEIRQELISNSVSGSLQKLKFRRDLAVTYDRMGSLLEQAASGGDSDADKCIARAYQFYLKGLEEKIKIDDEMKTEQSSDELATAYLSLARLEVRYGISPDTEKYVQNAIKIREELAQKRGSRHDKLRLARAIEIKGHFLLKKTQYIEAATELKKTYEIMEQIAAESKLVSDVKYLAELYETIGQIWHQQKRFSLAVHYYKKCYELRDEIVKSMHYEESSLYIEDMQSLAKVLLELGQADDSEDKINYLIRAYNVWKKLSEVFPQEPTFHQNSEEIAQYINKISL